MKITRRPPRTHQFSPDRRANHNHRQLTEPITVGGTAVGLDQCRRVDEEGSDMTIYYDGKFARITDETFESRIQGGQTFAIRELEQPHAVRRTVTRRVTAALLGVAGGFATIAIVGGLEGAPAWVPSTAGVLAVLAVLARLVAARRRPLELRALYRGTVVTLVGTRDPLVLGQISRALLRVIELGDDMGDALGGEWATVH
jgi:hypothetical protein